MPVPRRGKLWGTLLFTWDLQRLYEKIASFEFDAAGLFVNVSFLHGRGSSLGQGERGSELGSRD
uniref:VapA/VapB family virulence-associated protein n=1 Tax=Rhodococcus hoagii TaxID=43767 RepID=UPI003B5958D5